MRLPKLKKKHKLNVITFNGIGTTWEIETFDLPSFLVEENIKKTISQIVSDFDKNFSRFRADSLVATMAKKAGDYEIPETGIPMVELYFDLFLKTKGLVTPLIGSVLDQAGYDANYSFKQKEIIKPPALNEIARWKSPILTIKEPWLLDFGAIGKGRLIDLIGKYLETHDVRSFSINAGGDILVKNKSEKIGLENPENLKQVIGAIELNSGSICGSAGNRRKWGEFHHIINPETLKPVNKILAVWAKAETAMLSDAMATCLFFLEPKELKASFDFEYLILYPDFKADQSSGFEAKLYEAN